MSTDRVNEVLQALRLMYETRFFQQKLISQGYGGYTDLGEEAIEVGALLGAPKEDITNSYFRGEGIQIRYKGGLSMRDQMAQWMFKKDSHNTISMVFPSFEFAVEHGVYGVESSLIGSEDDMLVGVALAQKLQKTGKTVTMMIGDGATSKGNFFETLNFCALFKLPMIIIVRGNEWAMSTTFERTQAADLIKLAQSFGLEAKTVDGNDAIAVKDAVSLAVKTANAGEGATLIFAKTYRMSAHSKNDKDEYRDPALKQAWADKDPVLLLETRLLEAGVDSHELIKIKGEVQLAIDEAYEWAAVRPDITPQERTDLQQRIIDKMWLRSEK